MVTTKIQITPYLAEYIRGKYSNCSNDPIQLPSDSDMYHVLWSLMMKRPNNVPLREEGNIEFALPDRRVGKDPAYFNYLSPRAAKIIERSVERLFNQELHQVLDDNMADGRVYDSKDVVLQFMYSYGIESISEDALLKNYYRWRDKVRKRLKRREYKKKLN